MSPNDLDRLVAERDQALRVRDRLRALLNAPRGPEHPVHKCHAHGMLAIHVKDLRAALDPDPADCGTGERP